MSTKLDNNTKPRGKAASGASTVSPLPLPLITVRATLNEGTNPSVPLILTSGAFDDLTDEQQLRFVQVAQGALRIMEAQLSEAPGAAERRRIWLAQLKDNGCLKREPQHRRTALAWGLPSFAYYLALDNVAEAFLHDAWPDGFKSEHDDDDPHQEQYSGLRSLGALADFVLHLARTEAEAIGCDLDEMMRGTLVGRFALGSSTACSTT